MKLDSAAIRGGVKEASEVISWAFQGGVVPAFGAIGVKVETAVASSGDEVTLRKVEQVVAACITVVSGRRLMVLAAF